MLSSKIREFSFVYEGKPVGKPRMTQRTKFSKEAKKFYAFRDDFLWAAKEAGYKTDSERVCQVFLKIYFPLPKKVSDKMKSIGVKSIDELEGIPHQFRPGSDGDNVLKAVCDSLATEDMAIYRKVVEKFWDDGNGPRVMVRVVVESWDYAGELIREVDYEK